MTIQDVDLQHALSTHTPSARARAVETFLTFGPDEARALRLLSDGRRLGLFPRPPRYKRVSVHERVIVEGKAMSVPRVKFIARKSQGLVVAINDDLTGEWWRPLRFCTSESTGHRVLQEFQEGEDCRRKSERRRLYQDSSGLPERRKGERRTNGR